MRLAGEAFASLIEALCQGFKFIFVPLYLLGQVEMVRRRTNGLHIGFLWMLGILHMAILLWVFFISGYIASRHVLPLIAVAMPFTALGIVFLGEQLAGRTRIRPTLASAGIFVVCAPGRAALLDPIV